MQMPLAPPPVSRRSSPSKGSSNVGVKSSGGGSPAFRIRRVSPSPILLPPLHAVVGKSPYACMLRGGSDRNVTFGGRGRTTVSTSSIRRRFGFGERDVPVASPDMGIFANKNVMHTATDWLYTPLGQSQSGSPEPFGTGPVRPVPGGTGPARYTNRPGSRSQTVPIIFYPHRTGRFHRFTGRFFWFVGTGVGAGRGTLAPMAYLWWFLCQSCQLSKMVMWQPS
jgi:hypothetical protein